VEFGHTRCMDGWTGGEFRGAALAVCAASVLLALGIWVLRQLGRHRRRRIAKRALGAERLALELLRAEGFEVLETQVRQPWTVEHGERRFDVQLRADAVVQRNGRRYVAEIKSTSLVADLKHGPTRRQLLEYAIAYGTDGVLLIDMHGEHVEEVTFPGLSREPRASYWSAVVLCVLLFLVGLWLGDARLLR
jgi:hypothetical protein